MNKIKKEIKELKIDNLKEFVKKIIGKYLGWKYKDVPCEGFMDVLENILIKLEEIENEKD